MRSFFVTIAVVWAVPLWAALLSDADRRALLDAQIVLLGEIHDNPAHHEKQATLVADMAPKALVWEMLTEAQAARFDPGLIGSRAELEELLGWEAAGWPDLDLYYPIFTAAPDARIYGAGLPREAARQVLKTGAIEAFGPDAAARLGLSVPLPEPEQSAREAFQMAAHCDALPEDMLPGMVDVQRMRDAQLAQVALAALAETGGPVAIITGNGHARLDWGVPVYLTRADPDLRVLAIGQSEEGVVSGAFDIVLDSPGVARPDPCDAFRSSN